MNKLTQPVPEDDDFGPALSDADLGAWVDRNHDALTVALQEARDQIARGEVSELAMEDIIARGRARSEASKTRI